MRGKKFREGEEVCHKNNLKLKMTVERILKKTVAGKPGVVDLRKVESVEDIEKKIYIIGIECHWWDGDKLAKGKFHSRELVPFNIGQDPKQLKVYLES
jgi:uncharacterized protein YodC (DUF2158 family)